MDERIIAKMSVLGLASRWGSREFWEPASLNVDICRRMRKHEWFVFEAQRHRIKKSLSDIDRTHPHIHEGKARRLLLALANALTRTRHRPTVAELAAILGDLKEAATKIKRDLHTGALFEARPFSDLVVAARLSARKRIASLKGRQE